MKASIWLLSAAADVMQAGVEGGDGLLYTRTKLVVAICFKKTVHLFIYIRLYRTNVMNLFVLLLEGEKRSQRQSQEVKDL